LDAVLGAVVVNRGATTGKVIVIIDDAKAAIAQFRVKVLQRLHG
jgi:hypothetical protein